MFELDTRRIKKLNNLDYSNGEVVLVAPDQSIPNGGRLF